MIICERREETKGEMERRRAKISIKGDSNDEGGGGLNGPSMGMGSARHM